jgi:hypothetical protein
MNYFLAQRKVCRRRFRLIPRRSSFSRVLSLQNPNGCAPKMTYFTSLSYTNYSMVCCLFPSFTFASTDDSFSRSPTGPLYSLAPVLRTTLTLTSLFLRFRYVAGNEIADVRPILGSFSSSTGSPSFYTAHHDPRRHSQRFRDHR